MNVIKDYVCVAVGVVGTFLLEALGGWGDLMTALLLFMIIDYITGVMVAYFFSKSPKSESGGLDSKAGYKGLCRKCVIFLYIIVGHELDVVLEVNYVRNAIVIGFLTNELISIVENAGLMGIPLPDNLLKALEVLKNKSGDNK